MATLSREALDAPLLGGRIAPMSTFKGDPAKKPRAVFVDWFRAIAVLLVVAIHILVSLEWTSSMSENQHATVQSAFRHSLQVGLPMFFYFSGRAMSFSKSSALTTIKKKILRLMVPAILCHVLIVTPAFYIGREYRDFNECMAQKGGPGPPDNFFAFYGYIYGPMFSCVGFAWLWFLPILFALCVVNLAFLTWFKKRYLHALPSEGGDAHAAAMAAFGAPLSFEQEQRADRAWPVWLRPMARLLRALLTFEGPLRDGVLHKFDVVYLTTQAVALAMCVVLCVMFDAPWYWHISIFMPYILWVGVAMNINKIRQHGLYNLALILSLLVSVYMAAILPSFLYEQDPNFPDDPDKLLQGSFGYVAMCFFYNLFVMQGFIDQVQDKEYEIWRFEQRSLKWRPLTFFVMMFGIVFTAPGISTRTGDIYVYPMYYDPWNKVWHVVGTWIWLVLLRNLGVAYYNQQLHEWLYKHVMQSSILCYLVHWLFIDIIERYLLWPFAVVGEPDQKEPRVSFTIAAFIVFPLTFLSLIGFYVLMLKVPFVGFIFGFSAPKKTPHAPSRRPSVSAPFDETETHEAGLLDLPDQITGGALMTFDEDETSDEIDVGAGVEDNQNDSDPQVYSVNEP